MDEDADLRQPLSEPQKSRICQSFRAAKALLTRKRPLSDDQTPSACKQVKLFQDLQFDDSAKRVPLAQLSPNSLTYYHGGAVQTVEACSKPLPSARRNKFLANDSRPRMIDIYKGEVLTLYTPKSQQCSSLLNLPSGDQLDDYLDDSVLEQIDALCGQRRNSLSGIDFSSKNAIIAGSLLMDEYTRENSSKSILITGQKFPINEKTLNLNVVNASADKILSISRDVRRETIKMEYRDYIQKLNTRQQEAVYGDINIPLMIVAGPGSGKTSTMVGRVLRLLSEGIRPSNILAMTFTIAAASEMRVRVGAVTGKSVAKEITMSTFHSFSLHLCRSHAEKLNRTSEFLIYGHGQQRRAIIEAVRLHENRKGRLDRDRNESNTGRGDEDHDGIRLPIWFPEKSKRWQKFVTQAKASGKVPSDYLKQGDIAGGEILQSYSDILESCNALDYHDLISCSVRLLTDFPDVFSESQESWKALVVDEFQDTSTMQYGLLRRLASHNRITIVGDEDQSIFSFNGADLSGFESFRKDFSNCKEVRLNKNYRSTKCIVEASAHLIQNNYRRRSTEAVQTDNCFGSKLIVKECHSEDGQCSFVIDKILEFMSNGDSGSNASFGSVAVLYRRQVSGKIFQTAFRNRKIPFNIHGVAFYRKKAVKSIVSLLKTPLPGCDDRAFRQATKALLPFEKEEIRRVIDHIDKVLTVRKCDFMTAASDIFNAKISGTFKRSELTKGRKVLSSLDMISRTVKREESISTVISFVAGLLPQKCVLDQRAVVDVDGGKLLNEDLDARSVLQYLLDDASDFLSLRASGMDHGLAEQKGCMNVLKSFIDYISERERDNFLARRRDNRDSVTLTTIHQSKGLEWDTVFIVSANDSEIPLLPEAHCEYEPSASIEEERRLFYVAMTRARRKLFILYHTVDSNWKMLQPSRFLKELPDHLIELQADSSTEEVPWRRHGTPVPVPRQMEKNGRRTTFLVDAEWATDESGCNFLSRFCVEDRQIVSHLFRKWAKKDAFKDPKRLVDKIGFAIDERIRMKKSATRDVLQSLKACLNTDSALGYAEYVLRWEEIPSERRAQIMREKEEHFQNLGVRNAMSSSEATTKQLSFLRNLGCTVIPVSRLHASHLIEQYKSL